MAETAMFTEPEGREHLVFVDDMGRPDECVDDCPGCHWEGNADCEALPYGCTTCDPDDRWAGQCRCGHARSLHSTGPCGITGCGCTWWGAA